MVVRLHPLAQAEFAEAIAFYEERAPRLGREFFEEVERVLRDISENPGIGSTFEDPYRRALCRRFPFAVIYREDAEAVFVQAVMHMRRRPGYWRERG